MDGSARDILIFATMVSEPRLYGHRFKAKILADLDVRQSVPSPASGALIDPGHRNFEEIRQLLDGKEFFVHDPLTFLRYCYHPPERAHGVLGKLEHPTLRRSLGGNSLSI